jgi:hypothetical protein
MISRKVIYLIGLFWFLFTGLSCKKGDKYELNEYSIIGAKTWFYNVFSKTKEYKIGENSFEGFLTTPGKVNFKANNKFPVWQFAIETNNSSTHITEIPLVYNISQYRQLDNNDKIRVLHKLVIIQNKTTGKKTVRIISFVPNRRLDNVESLSTFKISANFSGNYEIKQWNGKFIGGFRFNNGKPIAKILRKVQISTAIQPNVNTDPGSFTCDDIASYVEEYCDVDSSSESIVWNSCETSEDGFMAEQAFYSYSTCFGSGNANTEDCFNAFNPNANCVCVLYGECDYNGGGTGGGNSQGGSGNSTYDPNYPFSNLQNPVFANDDPIIENGINVNDIVDETPTGNNPRVLAQTENRCNSDDEDMKFGYNGDPNGIIPQFLLSQTDTYLFNQMSSLFYWCTYFDNELYSVGQDMIQRFRNRTGGSYSNPILNNKVKSSSALINFLKSFGEQLNSRLQTTNGDISAISNFTLGFRPVFNGQYNKFAGLQILINDTEYTEIQLDNFTIDITGNWQAEVTVTIHDHFGLDKHDALEYQAFHTGFPSWWILQHIRNYKPFDTTVKVRKLISGHLQ